MKRSKTDTWTTDGKAITATIGDSTFRIVTYPDDSPMAGKFGIYQDGKYMAAVASLAAAKTRCTGLANKNRAAFTFRRQSS